MKLMALIPGTKAWHHRREAHACGQALEHIHELVDEELPPGRLEERIRVHLRACRSCTGHVEATRELKIAVARVEGRCDPELAERLNRLAEELVHGTGPGEPPTRT